MEMEAEIMQRLLLARLANAQPVAQQSLLESIPKSILSFKLTRTFSS
jgi:hypothetical protein